MQGENDQVSRVVPPPPATALMHSPLYRCWRYSVVDTVDHRDVVTRIIGDSGLSSTSLFMTMMSAGIAVLGLLLSSPAEGPAREAAKVSAWAAHRWNIATLVVPGLPSDGAGKDEFSLPARRALAIVEILDMQHIQAVPGPAAGSSFRLVPPEPAT